MKITCPVKRYWWRFRIFCGEKRGMRIYGMVKAERCDLCVKYTFSNLRVDKFSVKFFDVLLECELLCLFKNILFSIIIYA